MSIRTDEKGQSPAKIQQGNSIPEDMRLPNCTIEDVDRALFNLFNKQLPFIYTLQEGTRRAPVIFATGERFAVLRRKQPLRDKAGALILPLVSIMRTGITMAPTMGAGTAQNVPMTIKERVSPEDPIYQKIVNKLALKNSDNLVSNKARPGFPVAVTGSDPGRIAHRGASPKTSLATREGKVFQNNLGNNIFEVITIPPPKYYTATYEVTFWSQYTQQMNDMIMSMMSLCQSYSQRTFRIETDKGYWFVAYIAENFTPGNNFDDFTDSERLVRYSFEITVPAYIVGSAYPGAQNVLRKYVSAPALSFDGDTFNESYVVNPPAGIPSGEARSFLLDDFRSIDEPRPGQAIGAINAPVAGGNVVAKIGGATTESNTKVIELTRDPFTGKEVRKKVFVKSRNRRSGETVLREDLAGC